MAEYSIKLMDIDADTLGIPETDYDAEVSMSSAEFGRLCRDLSALGESVRIEVTKEGVRFTSEGDAANGSVLLKAEGGGKSSKDKIKVKKEPEEDEDAQMDEDASEDDGGAKENGDDEEEEEESSSKKRKRSKASSEKARKTKKPRKSDGDDGGDEETGVKLVMSQQVNLTFSLKYLLNFSKSSSLCNRVSLSMSNEVPLLVCLMYMPPSIGRILTVSRSRITLDKAVSTTILHLKLAMNDHRDSILICVASSSRTISTCFTEIIENLISFSPPLSSLSVPSYTWLLSIIGGALCSASLPVPMIGYGLVVCSAFDITSRIIDESELMPCQGVHRMRTHELTCVSTRVL